ncbi:MAG: sce7725 family protein [Clostridiales Family XIII bacterium]|jgi:hypothetical protein|nr:sce7725 family protein [Clostridiales Family XIII bacterium]
MYFPYLRGRQFELLALKELLDQNIISNKVIPIIEPVKFSSTLTNTIDLYNEKKHPIALIRNPQAGSFMNEYESVKNAALAADEKQKKKFDAFVETVKNANTYSTFILTTGIQRYLDSIVDDKGGLDKIAIIMTDNDMPELYKDLLKMHPALFTLIPDKRAFKRAVFGDRVLLENKFGRQSRNTDYEDNSDEFFSDDHIYFKDEGYVGFSDYSIVGDEFMMSGFAPYAVAIHIVYPKDGTLRIRHFVSNSNEDIQNPAKKFSEAINKVVDWKKNVAGVDTIAMKTLEQHCIDGTYPGLGTIKKLCIMHHLELVSTSLDSENGVL